MGRQGCLAILALAFWGAAEAHRGGASLSTLAHNRQKGLEIEWSHELTNERKSPVRRIIDLLTKMRRELEGEAKRESETYDKMVCWCENGEKEKTQAVKAGEAKVAELESEINRRAARRSQLAVEKDSLKQQIGEDVNSLDQAHEIHDDLTQSQHGDEKSLTQSITNLKNAIIVVQQHHSSLIELDTPMISSLQVLLRDTGSTYNTLFATSGKRGGQDQLALLSTKVSHKQTEQEGAGAGVSRALMSALMGRSNDIPDVPLSMAQHLVARSAKAERLIGGKTVFLQSPSYHPQSGELLGVLKQMLSEFEEQLKDTRNGEDAAQQEHDTLTAAKDSQLSAARERLDGVETDAAANSKALSDDKEEVQNLKNQREADMEFLANLRKSCMDMDNNYELRSKTRMAELKAVSDAITVLAEDDHRERMEKALNFLQQSLSDTRRERAALVLNKADADLDMDDLLSSWNSQTGNEAPAPAAPVRARSEASAQTQFISMVAAPLPTAAPKRKRRHGRKSRKLAALSQSVRIDSFTKIKAMIDTLVKQISEQQKEDDHLKSYCQEEMSENEKAKFKKGEETKQLSANVDMLNDNMLALKEELGEARGQIAQTQLDIKKASQAREEENREFQTTVSDQRATQTILKQAMMKLKDFYQKKIGNKVAMVSLSEGYSFKLDQAPVEDFSGYKEHRGSSSVLSLMEHTLEESEALEAKADADERASQADYEAFVKDANGLIKKLSDITAQKSNELADAKLELAETESGLSSAEKELASLVDYEGDLHHQCDYVMANYDKRRKARQQEAEAMQNAKAILSGAK